MKTYAVRQPGGAAANPQFGIKRAISKGKAGSTGDDFFCKVWRGDIPDRKLVAEDRLSFAVLDGYPVNPGHTLIVPKRHVSSFFEASAKERESIVKLLETCKQTLEAAFKKKKMPVPTD